MIHCLKKEAKLFVINNILFVYVKLYYYFFKIKTATKVLLIHSFSSFFNLLFIYINKNMITLAHIPPPPTKMPIRKRPSSFITFDQKQKWLTNIGKLIMLILFFVIYLTFFALFLYFNYQWKSVEFRWKKDKYEICSAAVSMIDFIADISSFYFCITVFAIIGLLIVFTFKKNAISSHIYMILTV